MTDIMYMFYSKGALVRQHDSIVFISQLLLVQFVICRFRWMLYSVDMDEDTVERAYNCCCLLLLFIAVILQGHCTNI